MNTEAKKQVFEECLDLSPLGFVPLRVHFQNGKLIRITLESIEQKRPTNCSADIYAPFLKGLLTGMALEKFPVPFKLTGSPFQRHVWHLTMAIKHGETKTYGQLAKAASCASAQAVGQALKKNPLPIIVPCHRVVGKKGELTGFSAGIEIKRILLQFERMTSYENSSNERQPRPPLESEDSCKRG